MKTRDASKQAAKPKKKISLPGPGLKVPAFVGLMRRLEAEKARLTDEQVRFVQDAIHRFEHETEGQVKTKHVTHKPKKPQQARVHAATAELRPSPTATKGFIERLVKMANEEEALAEIERLSANDAEHIAREQGLRAPSPEVARAKLAENVTTLRDIERIAGAGKSAQSKSDREPHS